MRKAYIESFIILLFLSCCPFIVSSCHEEEKEEISDSPFDEEDIQHEQDLNAYLGKPIHVKFLKSRQWNLLFGLLVNIQVKANSF